MGGFQGANGFTDLKDLRDGGLGSGQAAKRMERQAGLLRASMFNTVMAPQSVCMLISTN